MSFSAQPRLISSETQNQDRFGTTEDYSLMNLALDWHQLRRDRDHGRNPLPQQINLPTLIAPHLTGSSSTSDYGVSTFHVVLWSCRVSQCLDGDPLVSFKHPFMPNVQTCSSCVVTKLHCSKLRAVFLFTGQFTSKPVICGCLRSGCSERIFLCMLTQSCFETSNWSKLRKPFARNNGHLHKNPKMKSFCGVRARFNQEAKGEHFVGRQERLHTSLNHSTVRLCDFCCGMGSDHCTCHRGQRFSERRVLHGM